MSLNSNPILILVHRYGLLIVNGNFIWNWNHGIEIYLENHNDEFDVSPIPDYFFDCIS